MRGVVCGVEEDDGWWWYWPPGVWRGLECALVASGHGKTSVSPSLLVVHSSYHHDGPPDGGRLAPPLPQFLSVCGFQT